MKKNIIFVIISLLSINIFANTNNVSIQIQFFPIGYKNSSFIIYNNEDDFFSNFVFQKIRKSSIARFYNPTKDRCEEGFYKILVCTHEYVFEYEVFAKNIVYDVKNNQYLKYDALSDIYAYLARKQLEGIVNGKIRFLY